MTALICLSVAVLAAGVYILMQPSSPSGGGHQVTIKNDGSVITVRSAGSGNITVTFDPADLPAEHDPVELRPGDDTAAEGEVTLLEEFLSPHTSRERKREIMKYLSELGYKFSMKEEAQVPPTQQPSAESPVSQSEPVLGQDLPPQEPVDLQISNDDDGCDEGLFRPLFENEE